MINKQSYQIQGMRQDNLVGTGFSSKFAHEIKNLRLNTVGDYTTASWTTEKGTKKINIQKWLINSQRYYDWFDSYKSDISAFIPIGQAVIDDNWILFGVIDSTTTNAILCLRYDDSGEYLKGRILFWGELSFKEDYPIETITFYENDAIQKVYWTDGINPPRVINIKGVEGIAGGFGDNPTQFDFVPDVSLEENVIIKKIKGSTGIFPPCTVKYAITYYRKYGQESNIVYDSPLYYPTKGNRACAEDELSGDAFEITVSNIDKEHNFDYIRLYSIIRTSDNATPIARIVEDKYIKDLLGTEVTFIDTNTTGRIIDPNILFYLGGNDIVVSTLDQKDNVLFLGNIEIKKKSVAAIWETIDSESLQEGEFICDTDRLLEVSSDEDSINNYYRYKNQLNSDYKSNINPGAHSPTPYNHLGNSQEIKIFKNGEWYRFGIQFQDTKGKWSDIIRVQDIECDKSPVLYENNADFYEIPYFSYNLSSTISSEFINKGYKKARLVCCYTTNSDRSFIAQGIANPTIYNEKQGKENDIYASWFFRDSLGNLDGALQDNHLGGRFYDNYEIQCFSTFSSGTVLGVNDPIGVSPSKYHITNKLFTLNSPDIEFDKSLYSVENSSFRIKETSTVVGEGNIDLISSIYIDATARPFTRIGEQGNGLENSSVIKNDLSNINHNYNYAAWHDANVYYALDGVDTGLCRYPIYPFQRSTLNDYVKSTSSWDWQSDGTHSIQQTSKINSKIFSTLFFSKIPKTLLEDDLREYTPYFTGLTGLRFINNDDNVLYRIKGSDDTSLNYYGSMNTIVNLDNTIESSSITGPSATLNIYGQYYIMRYSEYNDYVNDPNRTGRYIQQWDEPRSLADIMSSNPVELTYKSTPHVVFSASINSNVDYRPYIVELTRKISKEQRFGGINNRNCIYIPCGPAEILSSTNNTELKGYEGDHYFMRYDCLKTYPYTTEDVNQVIEIMSYITETRINLDGRYDDNRGLIDNTTVLPTNFNLINKSYTQSNNFFSFTELRDDEIATKVDKFPNQFTWTDVKVSGEEVDKWTVLTLASTADADGVLGKVNKIININDNLILFQDHGVAKINFNENTALQTTSGMPLELSKTGRYQGLNYISRECGCQNKWSISSTKNGLFWIDDSRQELMTYNGQNVDSFSTLTGMESFMIKTLPSTFKTWSPVSFGNFVTYYDKLSNDIYYINKEYCLAWNEEVKNFTSFYDYNEVPYMVNLGNHSLMWKNGIWAARELTNIKENNPDEELYSNFFNSYKDYWITIVCDGMTSEGSAFPADKVFNNIEYRADIFNMNYDIADRSYPHTDYHNSVFNIKHVWNGYQNSYEVPLEDERKFNTWRVQLPRHNNSRDRIRNPFCYIKLKQKQSDNTQSHRMILHDLAVYFDIQ